MKKIMDKVNGAIARVQSVFGSKMREEDGNQITTYLGLVIGAIILIGLAITALRTFAPGLFEQASNRISDMLGLA